MAASEFPVAFQKSFERYLGHSIYDMVSAGASMEESWVLLWGERCGTIFDFMIIGSVIWANVNLIRRNSVGSNVLTLLFSVAWFFVYVWASMALFPL